jgi:hypothetical protein
VGRSSSVLFAGYGDKKTPIGPGKLNYLEQWDTIPAPKLAEIPLLTTELAVEFADQTGILLFAGVRVPGLGNGNVSLSVGDFSDGKVKLMKICPLGQHDLVRQINLSPAMKTKLIDLGGGARVVDAVLIAIDAVLHSKFAAGLSSKGAVIVDGVMVRAEKAADWKNEKTVYVGEGTVIGYSLAGLEWDAVMDKNKTTVTDLRPDQQGL